MWRFDGDSNRQVYRRLGSLGRLGNTHRSTKCIYLNCLSNMWLILLHNISYFVIINVLSINETIIKEKKHNISHSQHHIGTNMSVQKLQFCDRYKHTVKKRLPAE